MIKTYSRRNSLTSISTTTSAAPSASSTTISRHDLSTDNLVSLDSKFTKKSYKKSVVGRNYPNSPHIPHGFEMSSSKNLASSANSSTSNSAYYFPNGEVFRPRVTPAKRTRPSKINVHDTDEHSVHSAENTSNDQISIASVSTTNSGATVPRASSYSNVKKLNKMHLTKNIRGSRDDTPTNISTDSFFTIPLSSPPLQQPPVMIPYQNYHSNSSTSLKNQGIPRFQSNNLLKAENMAQYSHTSSLSSSASKSSGSLVSDTPSTSVHTDEMKEEATDKLPDEEEKQDDSGDNTLELIEVPEELLQAGAIENSHEIEATEPKKDVIVELTLDSPEDETEVTSDQISQHSNEHHTTYDTSISTTNTDPADNHTNDTYKNTLVSIATHSNPELSSDGTSEEFCTANNSPRNDQTYATTTTAREKVNHRSPGTMSIYSEISTLPEPDIDDDFESFVDVYAYQHESATAKFSPETLQEVENESEESDKETSQEDELNVTPQSITSRIINIDNKRAIRIVSPTISSSASNSAISSPNTPKRSSRYFDNVDMQELEKLLNDTQEEVPPRGDVMIVQTPTGLLDAIPEVNTSVDNTPATNQSHSLDEISPFKESHTEKTTSPLRESSTDLSSIKESSPEITSSKGSPTVSPSNEVSVPKISPKIESKTLRFEEISTPKTATSVKTSPPPPPPVDKPADIRSKTRGELKRLHSNHAVLSIGIRAPPVDAFQSVRVVSAPTMSDVFGEPKIQTPTSANAKYTSLLSSPSHTFKEKFSSLTDLHAPAKKQTLEPPARAIPTLNLSKDKYTRRKPPPVSPLIEKHPDTDLLQPNIDIQSKIQEISDANTKMHSQIKLPLQPRRKVDPPPVQASPRKIKSFLKKFVPSTNTSPNSSAASTGIAATATTTTITHKTSASVNSHSAKVFKTLCKKGGMPESKPEEPAHNRMSMFSMTSLKLEELPRFEHEESMFDDVIDTFDKKLKEDIDIYEFVFKKELNKKNEKLEQKKEEKVEPSTKDKIVEQIAKEVNEGTKGKVEEPHEHPVDDESIKFLKQEVYWTAFAEKELTNIDKKVIKEIEEESSEAESSNKSSPPVSPESDLCTANEEPMEEDEDQEEDIMSMVIDSRDLNYLFNVLSEQQRRTIPSHLRYVRQFKDFKSVEISMKKFEDLTNSELVPVSNTATAPILKKKDSSHSVMAKKKVIFSNKIAINETFPAGLYKRFNKDITQYLLSDSRSEISKVKEELNNYKCNEMLVHESSQHNTHFFY